jgi:C4-dicarboxylate-specific signal transduction histidine kinase
MNKQKVLIVDDEPRNQRIIVEVLEEIVDLQIASSGEEALTILDSYQPDLVLLDLMMPGIDGYEVCKRIRANPKLTFTKVILVSGRAMIEERLKGYEVGADDYMTKPFASEELLAKAKVFLRLTRAEQELGTLNRDLDEKVKERTQQLVDAEAKLVTTAKMSALGEMAGGIAHEINTPLGTIGMIAEQLQELVNEETIDRKMVSEMTVIVGQTVQRISSIIQGLRTFSRDGSKDSFSSIPLKQVLENTLSLCRERIKHSDVKITLEEIGDDVSIQCRPVQISQIILNLVGNACDAVSTLQEKWIKISAECEGEMVQISVTDSGSGIPENVRDKVFQPFFTTKEIGKGTGLGLSISKGITDAHHGELTLDTKCPNTRFVLSLPKGAVK